MRGLARAHQSSYLSAHKKRPREKMSKPKILIFAPREEPASIFEQLEGAGFQVAVGNTDWQLPRGNHEDTFAAAARDAVALMGTSIRHTPVSRRIMEGSQRLRIVAKYT